VKNLKPTAFLPIILILTLTIALPITQAQTKPKLFIDPPTTSFTTDTTPIGTNFTVTIKAADWTDPGVYGYQFTFTYDKTMLKAVAAEIPTGHWFTPVDKSKIFVVDGGTIGDGTVTFAVSLLNPEAAKTGGGTIATVTLQINATPQSGRTLTSKLDLTEVIMVNPDTGEGYASDTYDIVPGTYKYQSTAPAPALPKIYVDPENNFFTNSTKSAGDNFTISVKAANWTTPGVFGYTFKLLYNSSLLEPVNANIPEDHWLEPANASNITFFDNGTINQTAGYVSFNVTLLNGEQGKTGDGTISNITFKILLAPTDGQVSCALDISNIILKDPTGTLIPTDQYDIVNGNYKYSSAPALGPDINNDGKVNIQDIFIWGQAFGSTPSSPRWNPKVDLTGPHSAPDGIIDIRDAVFIAMHWTG
jgi:hypothetical protein